MINIHFRYWRHWGSTTPIAGRPPMAVCGDQGNGGLSGRRADVNCTKCLSWIGEMGVSPSDVTCSRCSGKTWQPWPFGMWCLGCGFFRPAAPEDVLGSPPEFTFPDVSGF